jgi:ParB/RepB/Spo0J family partition protein
MEIYSSSRGKCLDYVLPNAVNVIYCRLINFEAERKKMKRIQSENIGLELLEPWDIAETLLPEYTEAQYQDLEEFINNGGQLAPVVIAEDKRIIDGYNRWRTAKRLGLKSLECDIYSYDSDSEMEMHAIVLNSKRRHLNKIQIARAAVRLVNLTSLDNEQLEEDIEIPEEVVPVENQMELVETESKMQENQSSTNDAVDIQPVEQPEPVVNNLADNPPVEEQEVKKVSKKLGVAQSVVKQVRKVDNCGDKNLITAMEDKVVTIKQAAELADLDEEKRKAAIEAYDLARTKRNNVSISLTKYCDDFMKKLKNSRKKIEKADFSLEEYDNLKNYFSKVIGEAQEVISELDKKELVPENSGGKV